MRRIGVLAACVMVIGACSDDAATTQPATTGAATTSPIVTTTTVAGAGLVWTRVAASDALGGPGMQLGMAMVAGGPGLVAVGGDESNGDPEAAVWVSADGQTWESVPDVSGAFGGPGIQLISAVTRGGPGLVAVGQDDPEGSFSVGFVDSDAAVWVSADGYEWIRVPHDEAVFGGPGGQRMVSVAAGGPGLVAVGSDYRDGSGWPDGAVWVSADGYAWTRVDDEVGFGGPGGQEILAVTSGGPGVVAAGSVDSYERAAVWVSADGLTWTRIEDDAAFGGQGRQEMSSVVAGGPGLVGAGGDVSSPDEDVAVWVSADGLTWTRIEDDAGFGGPGTQTAGRLGVWANGLVLVCKGESATGASRVLSFMSSDGYLWTPVASNQDGFGAIDELEIGSVLGWGPGLALFGGFAGEDWEAAMWVGVPTG